MEYVRVETTISAPIDQVWAVVAGFGALVLWCPSIKACSLEGEGIGSIRTAYLKDTMPEAVNAAPQRERLEAINAKEYRFSYTLMEPSALPLKNIRSTMQLLRLGQSSTGIVWSSAADDTPAAPKDIAALVDGFYRECLAKLKSLLELNDAA